jgi:glycosyltransferase involved in cell wall biosynthesis/SAM-dependent methyltransferase
VKRIAVVVQRCHESIAGGSEALAWQYANLLKDAYRSEVLTTTATSTLDWANALPAGDEIRESVLVRRFPVTLGRTSYWGRLHEKLLKDYKVDGSGHSSAAGAAGMRQWSLSLQEEFVRTQGPYSEPLLTYLNAHWGDYQTIIFITYLYATSYFGLWRVPPQYALFAPTLHNEEPAYLSVYKYAALRARSLIWLTEAEQRLGESLWGKLPGSVVGMNIDTELRSRDKSKAPYLLYCGRIDPNKGCYELFDYFVRFKEEHPSNLRLVLAGIDDVPVPNHPDIDFRGFVSPEEKFSLMAGARALAMPSAQESFSIVTLEAMAQCTAILGNARSSVINDHITQSGAGRIYLDYPTFVSSLNDLLSRNEEVTRMQTAGRDYVLSRYQTEHVREKLIQAVESCSAPDSSMVSMSNQSESNPIVQADEESLFDSPPLPLPAGWSEDELYSFTKSILVDVRHVSEIAEIEAYARADFRRFVYTLALVPDRPGIKVLELGANPYFTTTLIRKFRTADLHLANFFEHVDVGDSQCVTVRSTGEVISYQYQKFNAEHDPFPYDNDTFDVVLFCEIIEHLQNDPVHALIEIRRILRPGGMLVVTTPNVVRLENVLKLIKGENIYDPYSDYGPYGRHNREYNQQELEQLLSDNGFRVTTIFSADAQRAEITPDSNAEIMELLRQKRRDLGQYIFCQSTIDAESKTAKPVRPQWLYRSYFGES